MRYDFVIIGGGAAGVFGAIRAKTLHPESLVLLLEKSTQLLSKVKISGGGRCNVTHHCFDPKILVENYPRGKKELLSVFHQFGPKDTFEWFSLRGVDLKVEEDGRVFPTTDSSQTIIDCFMNELQKQRVEIFYRVGVTRIEKQGELFFLSLSNGQIIEAKKILLATGSHPSGLELAKSLGHHLVESVPSLFTFNVPSSPLLDLAGTSIADVVVKVGKKEQRGPILLTHWGFSGPCVIKLSAFGALDLAACQYQAECIIDYLPDDSFCLKEEKRKNSSITLKGIKPSKFTEKFWNKCLERVQLDPRMPMARLSDQSILKLEHLLRHDTFRIEGKTTYKQEFVTAGGVDLKEVDFRRMESKICPHLYFAGEVLNIDGITGGFNFQNAWSTSFIAASQ